MVTIAISTRMENSARLPHRSRPSLRRSHILEPLPDWFEHVVRCPSERNRGEGYSFLQPIRGLSAHRETHAACPIQHHLVVEQLVQQAGRRVGVRGAANGMVVLYLSLQIRLAALE